jgi:hypothetical protein
MSSEPKDWDALPGEEVHQHPGERRPAPRLARGKAAEPPLDDDHRSTQEEKAARLLRQLQLRMDSTRPRDALSKAINKALRRDDRRQRAARAPFADIARHETSAIASVSDIPLDVDFVEGCDVREQQKWFLELPVSEQERLRATWARERELLALMPRRQRLERVKSFGFGLLIFSVVALPLGYFCGWQVGFYTLLAGLLTGMAWTVLPFGRFWCAGTAGLAYFATFFAPVPLMAGGMFGLDVRLCSGLLVVGLAAAVGTTREWGERGGFRSQNNQPSAPALPEPSAPPGRGPRQSVDAADAPRQRRSEPDRSGPSPTGSPW